MILETERLLIRNVSAEDADDIFEYAQDADTGPRAGWPPHTTIEDTKKVMEKWLDPNNVEKIYVLVDKKAGKVIGTIGVVHINERVKDDKNTFGLDMINSGKSVYELGITIGRKYWGVGIGTESLAVMIDYVFDKLYADIVMTLHYEANIGSKRIQEKNNMKMVGAYDRDKPWYNTDCTKMIVRAKTRDEWLLEKKKV